MFQTRRSSFSLTFFMLAMFLFVTFTIDFGAFYVYSHSIFFTSLYFLQHLAVSISAQTKISQSESTAFCDEQDATAFQRYFW